MTFLIFLWLSVILTHKCADRCFYAFRRRSVIMVFVCYLVAALSIVSQDENDGWIYEAKNICVLDPGCRVSDSNPQSLVLFGFGYVAKVIIENYWFISGSRLCCKINFQS